MKMHVIVTVKNRLAGLKIWWRWLKWKPADRKQEKDLQSKQKYDLSLRC